MALVKVRNGVLDLRSTDRPGAIYTSARLIEGEIYFVFLPPYSDDLAIVAGPGLDDQLWSFAPVEITDEAESSDTPHN